jgi:hypothetical protein
LLRPVEPVFLAGLRADFFATAFLAAGLRADFLEAGLRAGAALTALFGLLRDLAAAFLGFLTTLGALVAREVTASLTALPAA